MASQEISQRTETEMTSIGTSSAHGRYKYVEMREPVMYPGSIVSPPANPTVFQNQFARSGERLVLDRSRWACWVKVTALVYGTFALIDLLLLFIYSNRFGSSYQVLILQTVLDCGMIFASWIGNKASKLKERKSAKVYFKTLVFFGSLYLLYLFMILVAAPYHEVASHILWETGYGRRLVENRDRNSFNTNNQFEPTDQKLFNSLEDLREIQAKYDLSSQEMLNFYNWVASEGLPLSAQDTLESLMNRYLNSDRKLRHTKPTRQLQNEEEAQKEEKNEENTNQTMAYEKSDVDDMDDIDDVSCNHVEHARRRERRRKIELVESIVKFCAAAFYLCAVSIFAVCFLTGLKLYKTCAILEKQYPVFGMTAPVRTMLFQPAGVHHI
jgi:hypothetical protein